MRSLKIVACAYACNPCLGSEGGVGWGWIKTIARRHRVWVLTDPCHRNAIERRTAEASDQCRNLRFVYITRRRWRKVEAVWPPAYLTTYRMWQHDAYLAAAALHRKLSFDLVHVITYVGFRVPGPFFRLGIPLVWGPIGGLENTPWKYLPWLGIDGAIHYAGRNIINSLHKRFLRLPLRAFKAADGAIVAATSSIQREVRRFYDKDSTVICEVGCSDVARASHSRRSSDEPLRISWSGQHLPGKALPLLLEALARLPFSVRWSLAILGDGPCSEKWRRFARRLGLAPNCRWHGHLSRDEALTIVHDAHLFVSTSLKDLTSSVIVEAMAQGVPILCPDHCGFSDAVDDTCGMKLAMGSVEQFISSLAQAIACLHDDEELRRRLAGGALIRARKYSWEVKANELNEIYQRKIAMAMP